MPLLPASAVIAERLYTYQVEAVEFAASRTGAALLMEQGTGKTFVAAGLIERLAASSDVSTHLVIVPLVNLQTTWERVLATLSGVQTFLDWPTFRDSRTPHRLLLLHYEAMRGKAVKRLVKRRWSCVIYDESQRLKKRSSGASRAAKRFSDVGCRVALSGTPIEQSPQDLWAQLRFTNPEIFGTDWEAFAHRWLRPTGFMGYKYKFRMPLMPKFLRAIAPAVFRVTKREVLTLPKLTFIRERVPLLGDQARLYLELARENVARLPDGRILLCDMEITLRMKLRQIAGGFVKLEDETIPIGDAKRRRLGVVLRREAHRGPPVIFCEFLEEIDTCVDVARRVLGGEVGVIRGKTRRERTLTIDRFQAGELSALVCQTRSGGVGIDLFRSCVVVFYSLPDSSIDFEQALCRVHRNGQTRGVRVISIQAVNTVDETTACALAFKKSVSQQVLDDHRPQRIPMAKPENKPAAPPKSSAPAAATKTDAKPEKEKPTPPPPAPKPKYGVPELAEALGVKPTSLRVRLRSLAIPKNGKVYGWDTKAAMQEVVDKLKEAKPKAAKAKATKAKDETEEDVDSDD